MQGRFTVSASALHLRHLELIQSSTTSMSKPHPNPNHQRASLDLPPRARASFDGPPPTFHPASSSSSSSRAAASRGSSARAAGAMHPAALSPHVGHLPLLPAAPPPELARDPRLQHRAISKTAASAASAAAAAARALREHSLNRR